VWFLNHAKHTWHSGRWGKPDTSHARSRRVPGSASSLSKVIRSLKTGGKRIARASCRR